MASYSDGSKTQVSRLRSHVRETCQSKSQPRIHSGPVSDRYEVRLYELMLAISGIQIVEHERKRERAKEKSEVRSVLGFFCFCFFQTGQKTAFQYGGLFFP